MSLSWPCSAIIYDPHFDLLHGVYGDIKIIKALPFLWAVRGDQSLGDR